MYYFTFMQKQPLLKHCYVKINGTYNEAREKLYSIIKDKWGFQYPEADFLPQIDKWHLKEVSLETLRSQPELLSYYDE
jgi:hypothetical protein